MSIYKPISDDDIAFRIEEVFHDYNLTSTEISNTAKVFTSQSG